MNCEKIIKMSKIVSTKQQLEKLVSLMEKNPQLAKGICSKIQAAKKWEEIAVELNCLGPPVRTTTKWIKVWADMKSKTKKKVTENRAEYRATGGGPNKLHTYTNIEEAIIGLLQLNSCVNPPGIEFGLETIDEETCEFVVGISATSPNYEPIEIPEIDNEKPNFAARGEKPIKEKGKKCAKTERLKLLETQVTSQKKFHEEMSTTMKEIKSCVLKTEEYTKKMYYLQKDTAKELLILKKEKLQLYKDEVLKSQQDRKAKLKLKVSLLELKKQMLPKILPTGKEVSK